MKCILKKVKLSITVTSSCIFLVIVEKDRKLPSEI